MQSSGHHSQSFWAGAQDLHFNKHHWLPKAILQNVPQDPGGTAWLPHNELVYSACPREVLNQPCGRTARALQTVMVSLDGISPFFLVHLLPSPLAMRRTGYRSHKSFGQAQGRGAAKKPVTGMQPGASWGMLRQLWKSETCRCSGDGRVPAEGRLEGWVSCFLISSHQKSSSAQESILELGKSLTIRS